MELTRLIARRLPWWLVLLVGVACVALGAVLTADPSLSLSALDWLVAAAAIATGVGELTLAGASARPSWSRVVGAAWIVTGVIAASWPGITVRTLSTVVGVGLIAGGAAKIRAAFAGEGDERLVAGLGAATSVIVGLLALSWPGVTLLVVAILIGVRTMLFGFGQIALAWRMRGTDAGELQPRRRWPRGLRLTGTAAALLVSLAAAAVSAAIDRAAPSAPGPFYTAPSPLPPGPPGTIVRSEVVNGFHAGATAYRVLYTSTGYDGKPAAVSGLVVVPDGHAPVGGRDVIAYTHGTVGVASNCAPSLARGALQPLFLEGGAALLAAGYVVAASDYQGLGTPGPHPYLVGDSEGMNELDIVRAAHNLAAAHAGTTFAVWGHSQGGHAALFTGQLAATYAPELRLAGVAAGAPVPNLVDLFKVNVKTTIGKVLIAMALQSWARVYRDAALDQIVTPAARPIVTRLALTCLYDKRQILGTVPGALALGLTFLHTPPWEREPWRTIAERNTPGRTRIPAPVLIVQGDADSIVDAAVTRRLVDMLCGKGERADLRLYPGVGHLVTGSVAAPDVESWIADRFAGKPAPTSCT